MKNLRFGFHLLAVSCLVLAFSATVHAQATRTWVSGVGDDVNPCSRTAPCKTFAGAISKTAAGGEINCLDPGGFGAVTITKSIIIDCHGTLGSVLHSGGPGITINALATDLITIRNVAINGAGTTLGTNGINIVQAKLVNLENVNIDNDSNAGILMSPTNATIRLVAHNLTISNAANGMILNVGAGTITAHLEQVRVMNAGTDGIRVGANSRVFAVDCMLSNNGVAINQNSASADVFVNRSSFVANTTGASTSAGLLAVTSSMLRLNGTGLNSVGGLLATDGNNFFGGNSVNAIGPISSGVVGKI